MKVSALFAKLLENKKWRLNAVYWAEYDRWVGVYYDRTKYKRYVCLVPCLVFEYTKRPALSLVD